jgi:TolB protein
VSAKPAPQTVLAFVRTEEARGAGGRPQTIDAIWTRASSAARPRRLVDDVYAYARPAWSPDGRRLVFAAWRKSRLRRPRLNLAVVSLDGRGRRWLTADSGHDYDPAWSPDGRSIVFTSDRSDARGDLWTMDADGGGQRKLLGLPGVQEAQAAWSPSGRRIVFTVARGLAPRSLATASSDGGGRTRLASPPDSFAPAWSPDGRRIAFAAAGAGGTRVYVVPASGGRARALTGAGYDSPAWSPAGGELAVVRRARGGTAVFSVGSEGGRPRRLTAGPTDRAPAWARR